MFGDGPWSAKHTQFFPKVGTTHVKEVNAGLTLRTRDFRTPPRPRAKQPPFRGAVIRSCILIHDVKERVPQIYGAE
jgi:hypothetical protein